MLNIVHLWNRINKIVYTNDVDSSFDHKVTSSIIIIFKFEEVFHRQPQGTPIFKPWKRSKIWGKWPPPLSECWLRACKYRIYGYVGYIGKTKVRVRAELCRTDINENRGWCTAVLIMNGDFQIWSITETCSLRRRVGAADSSLTGGSQR